MEIVTKVLDNAWFLPYIPPVAIARGICDTGGLQAWRQGARSWVYGSNRILVAGAGGSHLSELRKMRGGVDKKLAIVYNVSRLTE